MEIHGNPCQINGNRKQTSMEINLDNLNNLNILNSCNYFNYVEIISIISIISIHSDLHGNQWRHPLIFN